jgi:uncharacterized protein YndB with AHSA1/START domain
VSETSAAFTPSITIVRTIGAPVADVFAAWTEPTLLQRWLSPDTCECVEATADPRPGGRYRLVIADPSGGRHVTSGEYREVIPGQRLVQTWVLEAASPEIDNYPTLLTVDFRPLGPHATELTLRQDQLLTIQDREGNREGWRQCLNKLAALMNESSM